MKRSIEFAINYEYKKEYRKRIQKEKEVDESKL